MSRIENASDEDRFAFSLSGHAGDKPFLLQRKANRFRVEKRRFYNNSFHPFLFAHIEPTAYGSRINGHFAMGKLERAFMAFWFASVVLFGIFFIPCLIMQYQSGEISEKDLLWVFHPIGMIVFGYLMDVLGKFLARKEAPAITAWLCDLFADVTLQMTDERAQQRTPTEKTDHKTQIAIPTHRYIPAKKSYWKYLLAWVVLAIFFAMLTGSFNWRRYNHIANYGQPTQATVIALLPHDHNTVQYQYQVNGQTFEGQMSPSEPIEQMKVGQMVVVYYDAFHPEESVLGDPKPILQNETIFILLVALIAPTLIVLGRLGDKWW